jgi:hypothetical protein
MIAIVAKTLHLHVHNDLDIFLNIYNIPVKPQFKLFRYKNFSAKQLPFPGGIGHCLLQENVL